MDDDLSDLLGPSAPPTKRKRGRPPNTRAQSTELLADDPDLENLPDGRVPDPSEFHRPVRVTFLATIFQTEPRRLHRKLSKCPVIGWENHKGQRVPVYDFKQAVQYIVDPKVDIATWIKSQTPATLPVHINKAFWEAENSKLRWMERARHYWHDEDVLDVLGRTALAIKESAQLWVENLPGKASMTTAQFEAMQANVTELLDDIHERLVAVPAARRTESVARSMDDLNGPRDGEALGG